MALLKRFTKHLAGRTSEYDEEGIRPLDPATISEQLLRRPEVSLEGMQPTASPYTPSASPSPEEGEAPQAYSHGLEEIYALEDVDPSTIRRMADRSQVPVPVPPSRPAEDEPIPELSLELGDPHRGWMPSLLLHEPIQVLGMPASTEKALLEAGKEKLKDLIAFEAVSFGATSGIGQGHLDTTRQALAAYLAGRNPHQSTTVEWDSLLNALFGTADRKDVFLALEPFGLAHMFPLSPVDQVSLRRESPQRREELRQQAQERLPTEQRNYQLQRMLRQVIEVFIKPWIRQRGGLVTTQEVQERFRRVGSTPAEMTDRILEAIGHLFFPQQVGALAEIFLPKADVDLVTADSYAVDDYHYLMRLVKSYYYVPGLQYDMDSLIALIEKETTRNWRELSEDFVVKALLSSKCLFAIPDRLKDR